MSSPRATPSATASQIALPRQHEPTSSIPATAHRSTPELDSPPASEGTDSAASDSMSPLDLPGKNVGSPVILLSNRLACSILVPGRKPEGRYVFRQISGEEYTHWRALGDYDQLPIHALPSRNSRTSSRPASLSSESVRSQVSPHCPSNSHPEGDGPYSPTLSHLPSPQRSQNPPPRTRGTSIIQPTQIPCTRPPRGGGTRCNIFFVAQFVALSHGISQPIPCSPKTVLISPAAPVQPTKRKREDNGDVTGEEASDKKRIRRPPAGDVNQDQ